MRTDIIRKKKITQQIPDHKLSCVFVSSLEKMKRLINILFGDFGHKMVTKNFFREIQNIGNNIMKIKTMRLYCSNRFNNVYDLQNPKYLT